MINSVNTGNAVQLNQPRQGQPLSEEQKEILNDIISKYDSSCISKPDFENMMTEIKDAGIKPSRELRKTIEDAGFQMPEGKPPEGVKGGERPEPPKFMMELMDQLEAGEISEDELQLFIENFKNENSEGTLVDKYA